jgi:sigma-E factor negative regulatory protein RseB
MSFVLPIARRRWLPALAFGVACGAQAAAPVDPMAWLQRATQASRNASYAGTYVHTNGERTNTVRVTHVNVGGDEHERIEPLDGPPHEIVRRNDEMFCYFPDAKTVRLDRRINAQFFPSIFRASAEQIGASYKVELGKTERVLGYDCQWIKLQPRDNLRFAQRLCAEVGTGLIVRAKAMNADNKVVEQYTFTELRLGNQVGRADAKSIFQARVKRWTTDAQPRDEAAKAADTGWKVGQLPTGFRKVAELKRAFPGRDQPVSQLIFTDGIASLSVFVEANPAPGRTPETSSEDGTTAFYARPMGGHLVTVLGEVPLAAARQVGLGVSRNEEANTARRP